MKTKKIDKTSLASKKRISAVDNGAGCKQMKTTTYRKLAQVISQDAFAKFGSSFDKLARFDR